MSGLMPAVFFGHGTPMNAIADQPWTRTWAAFGAATPRPRAVLVISAHWYINATAVTAMARPRTIHDFFGFPPALFEIDYPAPGDPQLAAELVDLLAPTWVGLDHDSWGLDHGTWSVLRHIYPDADVPVIQLSIDATQPFEYHLALGAALAPLRARGVLIVGSGNVIHNRRAIGVAHGSLGADWANEFNDRSIALMADRPEAFPSLTTHPAFRLAAPTDDHFIPALHIAGLAAAAGTGAELLLDGATVGHPGMTSFVVR